MKIRFLFLPVSFVTLCVVLGTTTSAQICTVDLRQVTGRAQCSPGCESCTFRLFSGTFEGTGPIQCLEAVPCLVEAIHASNFAFKETELRAETASKLTIVTEGDGGSIWKSANIYAPGNGGDFHWESRTIAAVRATNFYATDSGLVSFVFRSEDNAVGPAFHSMDVFAATARKLTIWLESGTEFGVELSRIQCPEYDSQSVWPTCVWKSDGSPVDSGASIAVKFITEKGTPRDVYFDCLNLDACKRIWVYCNGEEENCEMLYSGSHWYCHGPCECPVPTTTTLPTTTPTATTTTNPTTTTPLPTTSTRIPTNTTPKPSTTTTLILMPTTTTPIPTSTTLKPSTTTPTPTTTLKPTTTTPMPTTTTRIPTTTTTLMPTTSTTLIPTTTTLKPTTTTRKSTTTTVTPTTTKPISSTTTVEPTTTTLKPTTTTLKPTTTTLKPASTTLRPTTTSSKPETTTTTTFKPTATTRLPTITGFSTGIPTDAFTTSIHSSQKPLSTMKPPQNTTIAAVITTSETTAVTTAIESDPHSGNGSDGISVAYALLICFVIISCLAVAVAFYFWRQNRMREAQVCDANASGSAPQRRISSLSIRGVVSAEPIEDASTTHFHQWFNATFEPRFAPYLAVLCEFGVDSLETLALMTDTDLCQVCGIPLGHCKLIVYKASQQSLICGSTLQQYNIATETGEGQVLLASAEC